MKNLIHKIFFYIKSLITIIKKNITPLNHDFYVYNMYVEDQKKKCYETFKNHFSKSIFLNRIKIHNYVINKAIENNKNKKMFFLEFGVYNGASINFFSKFVDEIYGFDSFKGLKDDMEGTLNHTKGLFKINKIPKVNKNVHLIIGWIENTLDIFLQKHQPEIAFVHIDVDTYKTTKFILDKIKPYLTEGSIILFDELYNFPGWDVSEYKALKEVFKDEEYNFLCFGIDCCRAAIVIKKLR